MRNGIFLTQKEKRVFSYILSWLVIFIGGAVIYYQLYSSYPNETASHTFIEKAVRACASAFDLFLLNIDSNGIDGWLENSSTNGLGIALAIVAIAAGAWTISMVVILLVALLSRWIKKRKALNKKETQLFVFVGLNPRSLLLADNIMNNNSGNAVCLFLVQPADENEEDTSIWNRMFKTAHYKHALYKALGKLDAQIIVTDKGAFDIPVLKAYAANTISWENKTSIHVFVLGDNETENIDDALNLANPDLWGDKYSHLAIHCHARRSNANRVVEDLTEKSVIEIIDSSHLSIELLKRKEENHPVRFVDLDKNGLVSSAFRSLIIGFSECGQDALRFLYEFSAFVSSKNKNDKESDIRSPFYCDIVDKQFDSSAARWMHHASALFSQTDSEGKSQICFHPYDYSSQDFYSKVLDRIISELNYVVVAVGDDRAGITLAVEILRCAIKANRVDPNREGNKFRIYVRSYDPNMNGLMEKIAAFYNSNEVLIQVFGTEKELYTSEMLVYEGLKQQAMDYHFNYKKQEVKNGLLKPTEEEPEPLKATKEAQWEYRRTQAFDIQKQNKCGGKLSSTLNLRREESQDYANALHLKTKEFLKEHGASALRLAQTEHLRWVAAHQLMGYTANCLNGKNKDFLHYGHEAVTAWRNLDDYSREYDFLTFSSLYVGEEQEKIWFQAIKDAQKHGKA